MTLLVSFARKADYKNVNYAFDRVRIRIMNSYDRASEEYRLLKRFHWLLKKSRDNIDFETWIPE